MFWDAFYISFGMLFTIGLASPDQLPQLLFVPGFCLVLFLYGIALFLEADFLHGLTAPFDYVEAVDDNRGVGKDRTDDAHHRIGKVHRYFRDRKPLFLRQFHQLRNHIRCFCAADHRNYRARFAMTVLVGEYREQVIVQRGLIDAQSRPAVPGQQYPVGGMIFLFPLAEAAQNSLVVSSEVAGVNRPTVSCRTGGHRRGCHTPVLKKPQTPRSSGCLRVRADKG